MLRHRFASTSYSNEKEPVSPPQFFDDLAGHPSQTAGRVLRRKQRAHGQQWLSQLASSRIRSGILRERSVEKLLVSWFSVGVAFIFGLAPAGDHGQSGLLRSALPLLLFLFDLAPQVS